MLGTNTLEAKMEDPFELLARSVDRASVVAEITRLDNEITERAQRITKLRTLLSILPEEEDSDATHPGWNDDIDFAPVKPTLADAIPRVMAEEGRDIAWSADEILAALTIRDWAPGGKTPRNSIAATLSRLEDEKQVLRVGRGRYMLPSETSGGDSAGQARPATLLDDEPEDS